MQENLRLLAADHRSGLPADDGDDRLTSTTAQTKILPRTGARPLIAGGMILGILAMLSFTRLTPGGAYVSHVLPGLLVIGVGMGSIFAPAFGTATLGVDRTEAGIASAMVNTSQQVGGSVGTRC